MTYIPPGDGDWLKPRKKGGFDDIAVPDPGNEHVHTGDPGVGPRPDFQKPGGDKGTGGDPGGGGEPGGGGIDPFERTPFRVPDMPAPPPPPPPAPDFMGIAAKAPTYQTPEGAFRAEEMWDPMRDYVLDWMENPNRYLSDLATATREEMDARLRHQEQQQTQGISEWAASKGLSGSSFEGEQMERMHDQQGRARLEEERALLEMMATAETQDRQAALNAALGVGEFGRGLGADRREDAMMKAESGLKKQALMLEAAVQGDRAAMDRARHELNVMEAMDRATLSRSELELKNEEINLRAYEIQNRLNIMDRDLALAWARHELDREKYDTARDQWERQFERDEERYEDDLDRAGEIPWGNNEEARYAFEFEGERPEGWDTWDPAKQWDFLRHTMGYDEKKTRKFRDTPEDRAWLQVFG